MTSLLRMILPGLGQRRRVRVTSFLFFFLFLFNNEQQRREWTAVAVPRSKICDGTVRTEKLNFTFPKRRVR